MSDAMLISRGFVAAVVVLVAGAAMAEEEPVDLSAPGAPAMRRELIKLAEQLQSQFVRLLRDPESARFSGTYLSESENQLISEISLCGRVNAKNAYGGYSGDRLFIINRAGIAMIQGSDPSIQYAWPVWCERPIRWAPMTEPAKPSGRQRP